MRKLVIFSFLVFALISCEKNEQDWGKTAVPIDENNKGGVEYVWPGYPAPKQVELLSRTAAPGWPGVYDYKFRIHLDGSQVDPYPLNLQTFAIPHVGPGGALIYDNVENDATYTINQISSPWIHYTIRARGTGDTLKYNLAKIEGERRIWFLRHGLTRDDGNTNMIIFVTH